MNIKHWRGWILMLIAYIPTEMALAFSFIDLLTLNVCIANGKEFSFAFLRISFLSTLSQTRQLQNEWVAQRYLVKAH